MTQPMHNPVPKRLTQTYTTSIAAMVLRQMAPALAEDVERGCERITDGIDAACDLALARLPVPRQLLN